MEVLIINTTEASSSPPSSTERPNTEESGDGFRPGIKAERWRGLCIECLQPFTQQLFAVPSFKSRAETTTTEVW